MKVVRSFLKAGVPLSKVSLFREILEETGYRLTDRRHLFDMIPFILKEEEAVIKNAIEGQHLGIVFDGTTRHGEAMAIVLRFVSDFWTIEQRVVRVQLVSKSMKGEEIPMNSFTFSLLLIQLNQIKLLLLCMIMPIGGGTRGVRGL